MKICLCAVLSFFVTTISLAENSASKHPVYRSRTGGSGSVDVVMVPKKEQEATAHAKIGNKALEQSLTTNSQSDSQPEKKIRKIPLARSGGSAATQSIELK